MADVVGDLAVAIGDICARRGWSFSTWRSVEIHDAGSPHYVEVLDEKGRQRYLGHGTDHEIPLRMALDYLAMLS